MRAAAMPNRGPVTRVTERGGGAHRCCRRRGVTATRWRLDTPWCRKSAAALASGDNSPRARGSRAGGAHRCRSKAGGAEAYPLGTPTPRGCHQSAAAAMADGETLSPRPRARGSAHEGGSAPACTHRRRRQEHGEGTATRWVGSPVATGGWRQGAAAALAKGGCLTRERWRGRPERRLDRGAHKYRRRPTPHRTEPPTRREGSRGGSASAGHGEGEHGPQQRH